MCDTSQMATNVEQLSRRIEEVVKEHLEACRREAEGALVRAFGPDTQKPSSWRRSVHSSKSENRRDSSELAKLREQLYEVVLAKPGETMAVLALGMGSSANKLQFPMRQLREAKQVRSAGQRPFMRYFPMTVGVAKSA